MGKTAKRQNKRAAAAVLAVRGGLGGGGKRTKNIVTDVSAAAFTGAVVAGMQTDDNCGVDLSSGNAHDQPLVAQKTKTSTSITRVVRAVEGGLCQEACVALDALLAEVERGERQDAAPLDLCSKVLGMCQRTGKAKPALRLLHRMDTCGMPVGVVQLRMVFFVCCAKGMVSEALALMSRRGEIDGDDGTGLSSSVRLLGTDVLVRGCGMIPGGVDSETAGLLLEGGLRGALGNGNNSEVWAPVAASQLKFHPPVVWKPPGGGGGAEETTPGAKGSKKGATAKKAQDIGRDADALAKQLYPPGVSGDASFYLVSENDGRRRPADRNELLLWAPVSSTTVPMEPPGLDPETDLVSVPNLPNSFSLVNLLTKKECASLRAAAHAVGWRRDAGTATQSVDDRLDYCEILMWPELVEKVFSRIKSHLPPGACGVNARWRFFRYGPDTVYRKHVDGSWPEAFLDENGTYVVDNSNGKKRSRLTLLMYLSDGFLGGGTTFYGAVPGRAGEVGAISVLPIEGHALCFPHGESSDSPVHEGSGVFPGPDGNKFKYIVRTDVLFEVETQ